MYFQKPERNSENLEEISQKSLVTLRFLDFIKKIATFPKSGPMNSIFPRKYLNVYKSF